MKINSINNSFKGWIKFNNMIINPNQITSIETSEGSFSPRYGKKMITDIFSMSDGKKYRYKIK